ncbi:MAG TPA: MarR family transcriptional regulator [Mycobacteriales bacterium]
MTCAPTPKEDDDPVGRFIERFAAVLTDSGVPRMPARVFAALVSTDSGRLTASELAEVLRVSPAAVSGAVRYLTQLDLAIREREPGSRRDVFRVDPQVLYAVTLGRDRLMYRWETSLREGIATLGEDTPAGHRMAEMAEFFEFLREEMVAMLDRWRIRHAESPGNGTPDRPTDMGRS